MAKIENPHNTFSIENLKIIDPNPPVWIRITFGIINENKKVIEKTFEVAEEDLDNLLIFIESYHAKSDKKYHRSTVLQIMGSPAIIEDSQSGDMISDLDHNYFIKRTSNNSFIIGFYSNNDSEKPSEFLITFSDQEITDFSKEYKSELESFIQNNI